MQVRTILSQNTTDITSARAFASLKQLFPTWEQVQSAPVGAHVKTSGKTSSPKQLSVWLKSADLASWLSGIVYIKMLPNRSMIGFPSVADTAAHVLLQAKWQMLFVLGALR